MLIRTRPIHPSRNRRIVASMESHSRKTRRDASISSRPGTVACACFPRRSISFKPNRRSSSRICKLIAGCVRLSRRAAAEKLPPSTTSRRVRNWSRLRLRTQRFPYQNDFNTKFALSPALLQVVSAEGRVRRSWRLIPALFSKLKMRGFTGRHMQFHFSEHVLDARLRELTRAGEAVGVEPQVFDLLVYLVENRDR